jgi:hypothetical protein
VKKIIFVFLYITVSFLIFEIGTYVFVGIKPYYDIEMWRYWTKLKQRALDPELSHQHIPGANANLYGVNIKINSKGLRDREFDYVRKPNIRRILFLGDSLTLGWGVPFQSLFTKLLEKDLTNLDQIKTEVINTGVGNYNSMQEFTYYKNEGFKYNADIVMLLYFINDAEPTPVYKKSVLIEKSIFAVFLWSQLNKIWAKFNSKKKYLNYYSDLYTKGKPGWENSKFAIKAIRDLAKNNKSKFIVAVCPELRLFKNGYPFDSVHHKIINFLKDSKIDSIDLLPFFKNEAEREDLVWVSNEDSHPNILGNKIITTGILKFLTENRKILK